MEETWEKQEITETLFSVIPAEAWIYENNFIPQANATEVKNIATAYVIWDYNWEIAKVNSWSTRYILAVPSIINWDMTLTDFINIISNKKLVYNWYGNLPASYTWTIFDLNWWFDYSETWWIIVYSGSINDLINNEDSRLTLTKNLQNFYSWTILENVWNIKQLVETEIDIENPSDEAKVLAWWTIDNAMSTNIIKDLNINWLYWWEEQWSESISYSIVQICDIDAVYPIAREISNLVDCVTIEWVTTCWRDSVTPNYSSWYVTKYDTKWIEINSWSLVSPAWWLASWDSDRDWIITRYDKIICWRFICDVDQNWIVEYADLSLISRSRGRIVTPKFSHYFWDGDSDGILSIGDIRSCLLYVWPFPSD